MVSTHELTVHYTYYDMPQLTREGPIADNGLNVRPNTLPNIRPIAIGYNFGY